MPSQKRDNDYYLRLVEKRHPAIHAQYLAGHFRSASAAILAAGVRQPPKQLHALLRAWSKASVTERTDFLSRIGATTTGTALSTSASPSGPVVIADTESRLTSQGKRRIEEIMIKRKIKMGTVMNELGRTGLDASIGNAMNHDHRLKPDLVVALQAWVDRH
jgi:hypothetical protein